MVLDIQHWQVSWKSWPSSFTAGPGGLPAKVIGTAGKQSP